MIGSIALMLLGAAAATPCESLTSLKLENATITSAQLVPEGPATARGGGGGRGAGGRGGTAQGARGGGNPNATQQQAGAQQPEVAGRRGGGPPQPPALLPLHCRVLLVLNPSTDSLINMELWLPPADKWNGKFMGVGNGGFAGSIQGRTGEMQPALRLGYATAGTDTDAPRTS